MKVDLSKMTDKEAAAMARRFRDAPCIVCGEPSTDFRKLHLSGKVAFLPVCDSCKSAPAQTLHALMEYHDNGSIPNDEAVGNAFRRS